MWQRGRFDPALRDELAQRAPHLGDADLAHVPTLTKNLLGWPSMTELYSRVMKTAISVPDATFERVERAADRLGVSRSEFFARAAERWLDSLEDDGTIDAINRAVGSGAADTAFTDVAAARLAEDGDRW